MRSDDKLLTTTALCSLWRGDSFDDGCESVDVARPVVEKLLVDVVFLDDLICELVGREARFQRNLVRVFDVTHEFVVCKPSIDCDNDDIYWHVDGSFIA